MTDNISTSPFDEEIKDKLFNTDNLETDLENEINKLVKGFLSRKYTIGKIVEDLCILLTNTSEKSRKRGTWILAQILKHSPKDLLNNAELESIFLFLCDRYKDHHMVIPAVLQATEYVIQMKNLPANCIGNLLRSLFDNVVCQQQERADRLTVYKILHYLIVHNANEMKEMGPDFVYNLISAIEGERDPRNLLHIFEWLPIFYSTMDLYHLAEDAFEIVACYFPIDFQPASHQANEVTREILAAKLAPCLYANAKFAEFCLPLLLEKLESSLKPAILDSLDVLIFSCSKFTPHAYEPHLTPIWVILKKLIYSNDEVISMRAGEALTTLLAHVSISENNITENIISAIDNTLKSSLQISNNKFLPATKILLAIAKVNKEFCSHIVRMHVPMLFNQCHLTNDFDKSITLLEILYNMAFIFATLFKHLDSSVLAEVPFLLLKSIKNDNPKMRSSTLKGFTKLAPVMPEILKRDVLNILSNVTIVENCSSVRKILNECLQEYAKLYPKDVIDVIVNDEKFESTDKDTLCKFLDGLVSIAKVKACCTEILQKMQTKIFSLSENSTIYLKYYSEISKMLVNTTTMNACFLDANCVPHFVENGVEYLKNATSIDNETLNMFTQTLRSLIKCVEDTTEINNHVEYILNQNHADDNKNDERVVILLFDGILTNFPREANLVQRKNILNILVKVAFQNTDKYLNCIVSQLIANLINKWNDENELNDILNEIEIKIFAELNKTDNKASELIICLFTWITKSLLMRGHIKSVEYSEKMVDLLFQYPSVADAFEIVMNNECISLNEKNGCVVRPLYCQKFFTIITKKLFAKKDEINSITFLQSLISLLVNAPTSLIQLHFQKLYVYILDSLQSNNTYILLRMLPKLQEIIHSSTEMVNLSVGDILPILINLTKYSDSMKVRISALNCLEEITQQYSVYLLLPFQQKVIYGLLPCLDDKKRLVRQAAVKTRCAWILLGSDTDAT